MDERTVIAQLLMIGPEFTSADTRGIVSFEYLHDLIGDGLVAIVRRDTSFEAVLRSGIIGRITYQVTQLGKDQLK